MTEDIVARIERAIAECSAAGLPPLAEADMTEAEFMAKVDWLSKAAQVELTPWQRETIRALFAGEVVLWPRKSGRRTVTAIAQGAARLGPAPRGHVARQAIVDDQVVEAFGVPPALLGRPSMGAATARFAELAGRPPTDGDLEAIKSLAKLDPQRGWLSRWLRRHQ